MALLATSADYTDKDFDSLLARMRSTITTVFPTWTASQVQNFGNLLVELYCFVGDVLGYYQDNQAQEARLATATQRKNLLAIARMLGYTAKANAAAEVVVRFTLAEPVAAGRTVTFHPPGPPAPVTNPTTVETSDPENKQSFQLLADAVIGAGASTCTATVSHSVLQEDESFIATGLADQEVLLANTPFVGDSLTVTADNGAYTIVKNFVRSTATDRHCVVVVDANDQATVRFGDGVRGALPSGTIVCKYRTGGGAAGNVGAGFIDTISGSFVDSAGQPVQVTVTNEKAASGGDERETDESIRINAPLSLSALERTVSREDYETHAREIPGVQRALMLTKAEDPSMQDNTGTLYIVPAASGFPTQLLKDNVLAMVTETKPGPLTFLPTASSPWYLDIGVHATLYLRVGYTAANVRADIIRALQAQFKLLLADGTDNPAVDFGFNIRDSYNEPVGLVALSDILNVVRDVEGVLRVGANIADFQLAAWRVMETTASYDGATQVLDWAHLDVPQGLRDFPRLKATVLGGSIPDVTLTIDGVTYPPG